MRVFISYRRNKGASVARALRDRLTRRARVFMDEYDIDDGEGLRERIRDAVSKVDTMLVLVTGDWAERLHGDADYVRWEIELAIEYQVRILVVRYNDIALPAREALPPSIRTLCDDKWPRLRESDFERDCRDLVRVVAPRPLWPSAAVPVLGIAGVLIWKWIAATSHPPHHPPPPACHVGESSYEMPANPQTWCTGTTVAVACNAVMPDGGDIRGTCRDGVPDGRWSSIDPDKTIRWRGEFARGIQQGTWSMTWQYHSRAYRADVTFDAGRRTQTRLTAAGADVTLYPVEGLDDAEDIRCGARHARFDPLPGLRIKIFASTHDQSYQGILDGDGRPVESWSVDSADSTTTVVIDRLSDDDREAWTHLAHEVFGFAGRVRDCTTAADEPLPTPKCGAHSEWKPSTGCVPKKPASTSSLACKGVIVQRVHQAKGVEYRFVCPPEAGGCSGLLELATVDAPPMSAAELLRQVGDRARCSR